MDNSVGSEICIFHLELDDPVKSEEYQYDESSDSPQQDLLDLVKNTIRSGVVVIVKFDTDDKNYISFINNIINKYPIYHRILRPLLNHIDKDYELAFRLIEKTVFVEIIHGIVIQKSINNIFDLATFDEFCYLVKDMVWFTQE